MTDAINCRQITRNAILAFSLALAACAGGVPEKPAPASELALQIDGQTLDPAFADYLRGRWKPEEFEAKRDAQKALLLDPERRAAMRAAVDRNAVARTRSSTGNVARTSITIPGPGGALNAYLYKPESAASGPTPLLVYFHGGGWLFGSKEGFDPAMRVLAEEAGIQVLSVDYRLSPEVQYPAAHNDAKAAYLWALHNAQSLNADPDKIGVGGDSAGGNMAVSITLSLAEAHEAVPAGLLLYYPVLDLKPERYASFDKFGYGYGLDKPFAALATELFLSDISSADDPMASPLLVKDFSAMPPTVLATSGFDILRDHGRLYAARVKEDGGEIVFLEYPGLIHSFLNYTGMVDTAYDAAVESARAFGGMLKNK